MRTYSIIKVSTSIKLVTYREVATGTSQLHTLNPVCEELHNPRLISASHCVPPDRKYSNSATLTIKMTEVTRVRQK